MTALVTGAAGFVGAALVRALADRGDDVLATDVVDPPSAGARTRVADITDPQAVRSLTEGVDTVFHVASLVHTRQNHAERVWQVNHGGTLNLLEACRSAGVKRFVYVSSASVVYQGRDIEYGDETLPYAERSQAPYADSKIAAERDVLAANQPGGLATCAIRPHVVYGPGDSRFLPAILDRGLAGRLTMGVGRASKLSDFTYIDNLTSALLAADARLDTHPERVGGRAYFVTNGEPLGFWEFIDRVLVALDIPPTRGRVPYGIAYAAAAVAEWVKTLRGGALGAEDGFTRFAVRYMCTHHYFSIEAARRDLEWAPHVSIDEGIARTIAYLRESGELERARLRAG